MGLSAFVKERKILGSDMLVRGLHGQPQCRRNVMMVGLPSAAGSSSLADDGACDPILGGSAMGTGDGVFHELSSFFQ